MLAAFWWSTTRGACIPELHIVSAGSGNAYRHISAIAMINFNPFPSVHDNAFVLANTWSWTDNVDNFTGSIQFPIESWNAGWDALFPYRMVRSREGFSNGRAESVFLRCGLMLRSQDSVRSHHRFLRVYLGFAFQLKIHVCYVRVAVSWAPIGICIYIGWCLLQGMISFRLTVIRLSQIRLNRTRLNHKRLKYIRLDHDNPSYLTSWFGVNRVSNPRLWFVDNILKRYRPSGHTPLLA